MATESVDTPDAAPPRRSVFAPLRRAIGNLIRLPIGASVVVVAVAIALLQRRRRSSPGKPRILIGISPLINIRYWAGALRGQGYEASTFVYEVYHINRTDDFDYLPETVFPRLARLPAFRLLSPFMSFLWGLRSFDVFVLDFDLGFLRDTWIRWLELPLLRLGGKGIIAIPYGSDVTDIRRCWHTPTKAGLIHDYPLLVKAAPMVARRTRHYERWATLIAPAGNLPDFVDRADVMVTSMAAIDADLWRPPSGPRREGPIRILHAPNHRAVKGTELLIRACDELRAEGVELELVLKERVPNSEVRAAMADSDVVAPNFVMGCYGLTAVEGMAMGKPVLDCWRPDLYLMYAAFSYAAECPIVDCPPERLKENIRKLVQDPELRRRLGEAGREYVVRHHSYEAMGRLLSVMVSSAWTGQPLPDEFNGSGRSPGSIA
jgi:glycosyltransferase involved in cell wall biosynthesis